jgi:hypothetical protein
MAALRVPPLHTIRCDDVGKTHYIKRDCNKGSRIMTERLTRWMEHIARSDLLRWRTNIPSGLNLRNKSPSVLDVELRDKSLSPRNPWNRVLLEKLTDSHLLWNPEVPHDMEPVLNV